MWGIKDDVIINESHNECIHSSQLNADSTQQCMHLDTSTKLVYTLTWKKQ